MQSAGVISAQLPSEKQHASVTGGVFGSGGHKSHNDRPVFGSRAQFTSTKQSFVHTALADDIASEKLNETAEAADAALNAAVNEKLADAEASAAQAA
ncbi:MAG: hypothetical protein D6744_02115 [Planctomycetota bacterium]|nr:MAG: hypothetical protein D6744_02115 [Planctomycetota bacterium]